MTCNSDAELNPHVIDWLGRVSSFARFSVSIKSQSETLLSFVNSCVSKY